MSTKFTKDANKFKELQAKNQNSVGEPLNQCNVLFYFVIFVFFVDELPFLGLFFNRNEEI